MKRRTNTGKRKPGHKLAAKLLTASLVMNPALFLMTTASSYVQASTTLPYKTPYIKSAIPDLKAGVGKQLTLDLSEYFDGAASYSSTVSPLQGFSASISGNLLILNNSQPGTATVSVTGRASNSQVVTDTFELSVIPDSLDQNNNNAIELGELTAYIGSHAVDRSTVSQMLHFISPQTVPVTPNSPPKPKNAALSVTKGDSLDITVSQLFEDMENDALTIETFSLIGTGSVSSVLSNNRITAQGVQPGVLSLNVSVADGRGGRTSNDYTLTVADAASGVNNPPQWKGIPGVTVTKGTYATVDLYSGFTDVDGDALQLNPVQISPSSGGYISAVQSQGFLKVYGQAAGTSTVTVSAYDGKGGAGQGTFTVSVINATYGNHAPVAGTIGTQTTTAGHPLTIDLHHYFTDADAGDTLTYGLVQNTVGVVTASLATHGTLVITPVGVGSAALTVTGTDSFGATAVTTFNVTVGNTAPSPGTVGTRTITMGKPITLTAGDYFTDPDADDYLFYTVSTTPAGIVDASLSSGQLTLTPLAQGTTVVGLKATDSHGGSSTAYFDVSVGNNSPQYVNGLEDRLIDPGASPLVTIPLTGTFTDADNDALTYEAAIGNPALAGVTITGDVLTVAPAAAGHGSSTVTVSVYDGHGGTAAHDFTLTLNQTPELIGDPIAPRTIMLNDTLGLNVSNRFADGDGDTLAYSAATDLAGTLTVTTALHSGGTAAYISGLPVGTNTVTLTATDSYGGTISDSFEVLVQGNNPPSASTIDDQLTTASQPITLYAGDYFTDADLEQGDQLTYTVAASTAGVVTASLSNGDELTIVPVAKGTTTLTLTAADQYGGTNEIAFNVTVANSAPLKAGVIADQTTTMGNAVTLAAGDYFTDPDAEDTLTYSAVSSTTGVVTTSVSTSGEVTMTPAGLGTTVLTLTATDNQGGTASADFNFTVENRLPVAGTIPSQATTAGSPISLNPGSYFTDLDAGDNLQYEVTSSIGGIVSTAFISGQLVITPEGVGTTILTVTATDNHGGASSASFDMTVLNSPPSSIGTPGAQSTTIGSDLFIELASYFTDPDAESLTYSVSGMTSEGIVTTSISSASYLTITPLAQGTTTLTVEAADQSGSTAMFNLDVTVENRAPVYTAGSLSDQTADPSSGPIAISLGGAFTDADYDELGYSASINDALVTVDITGDQLILYPDATSHGSMTVTVGAQDAYGGSAQTSFDLTLNREPFVTVGSSLPSQTIYNNNSAYVNITGHFTDLDGDTLTYTATTIMGDALTVTTELQSGSLLYAVISGLPRGTQAVTIKAEDGYGGSATDTFTALVMNNKPEYTSGYFTDLTINPDNDPSVTFNLAEAFTDSDGDPLVYTATSASAMVSVNIDNSELTLYPASTGHGTTYVYVTALDSMPDGDTTATFNVTLNRVPTVSQSIPAQLEISEGEWVNLTVSQYFTDGDGDDLSYTVTSDLGGSPYVTTMTSGDVYASIHDLPPGTNTVTLTAADSLGGTVSQTFTVHVNDVNHVPQLTKEAVLLQKTFPPTAESITAGDLFSDADGDSLVFTSVNGFNSGVIDAVLDSGVLQLTGISSGTTTVTVEVSDQHGGTVTESFEVVVNTPPEIDIPYTLRSVATGDSIEFDPSWFSYDLEDDSEELNLMYEVVSSNDDVVSVGEDGYYYLNGVNPGSATITVTAYDSKGFSATDSFTVEVEDSNEYYVYDAPVSGMGVDLDLNELFSEPLSLIALVTVEGIDPLYFISNILTIGDTLRLDKTNDWPYTTGTTTITVRVTDLGGIHTRKVKFNFYSLPQLA